MEYNHLLIRYGELALKGKTKGTLYNYWKIICVKL